LDKKRKQELNDFFLLNEKRQYELNLSCLLLDKKRKQKLNNFFLLDKKRVWQS